MARLTSSVALGPDCEQQPSLGIDRSNRRSAVETGLEKSHRGTITMGAFFFAHDCLAHKGITMSI